MDRVVREQLLELAVELGGEGLVVGHDQRRPAELGDDVGHREGLARAGDAEQDLGRVAAAGALDQLADRPGLIAGGLVRRDQAEGRRRAGAAGGGARRRRGRDRGASWSGCGGNVRESSARADGRLSGDRLRGFYAVIDRADRELAERLVVGAGARALQVRMKGAATAELPGGGADGPGGDPGGTVRCWWSTTGSTSRWRPGPTRSTSARTTCRWPGPARVAAGRLWIGISTHDEAQVREAVGRRGRLPGLRAGLCYWNERESRSGPGRGRARPGDRGGRRGAGGGHRRGHAGAGGRGGGGRGDRGLRHRGGQPGGRPGRGGPPDCGGLERAGLRHALNRGYSRRPPGGLNGGRGRPVEHPNIASLHKEASLMKKKLGLLAMVLGIGGVLGVASFSNEASAAGGACKRSTFKTDAGQERVQEGRSEAAKAAMKSFLKEAQEEGPVARLQDLPQEAVAGLPAQARRAEEVPRARRQVAAGRRRPAQLTTCTSSACGRPS